jgi:predicted RNase H-like nuclease (RuvC/YqgF family)
MRRNDLYSCAQRSFANRPVDKRALLKDTRKTQSLMDAATAFSADVSQQTYGPSRSQSFQHHGNHGDIEELSRDSSLTPTGTELKVAAKTLEEELEALKAEVQSHLLQENELWNDVTTLRQELADKAQRKHNLPKKALKGGKKALKGGLNQMKKLTEKPMNASWRSI